MAAGHGTWWDMGTEHGGISGCLGNGGAGLTPMLGPCMLAEAEGRPQQGHGRAPAAAAAPAGPAVLWSLPAPLQGHSFSSSSSSSSSQVMWELLWGLPAACLPSQYFLCQLALAVAPSQLCKLLLALKERSGAGPGQADGQASGRHTGTMPPPDPSPRGLSSPCPQPPWAGAVLLSSSGQEQGLLRHPSTSRPLPHAQGYAEVSRGSHGMTASSCSSNAGLDAVHTSHE